MADKLTYDGWLAGGRKIRAGATAEFYLVSPDGSACRPMFTEDQTEAIEKMDGIWTTVVPAAERPRGGRSRDKRPKLKLDYAADTLTVWCGPDKRAIASLKKDGFKFDKYSHRWHKQVSEAWFAKAITAYEAAGYSIDVVSDVPVAA